MTPNQRLARSIQHQNQSKELIDRGSLGKKTRATKHDGYSIQADRGNDLINRKYRETYGASLISREKSSQKQRLKRRSLRKQNEKDNSERFEFNKTIDVHNSRRPNSRKIGVDKGFNQNLATLQSNQAKKPYINRRMHY